MVRGPSLLAQSQCTSCVSDRVAVAAADLAAWPQSFVTAALVAAVVLFPSAPFAHPISAIPKRSSLGLGVMAEPQLPTAQTAAQAAQAALPNSAPRKYLLAAALLLRVVSTVGAQDSQEARDRVCFLEPTVALQANPRTQLARVPVVLRMGLRQQT